MSAPHVDRDRSEQPTPSTATAGSDPTQATSRSVSAREVRASEAQVEAARLTWDRVMPLTGGVTLWQAVADAVVASGPEADRDRRERNLTVRLDIATERLREQWVDSPAPGGWVCTDCGTPVESEPCPEHSPEGMQAERDRLAEVVARVEALFSGGPDTPCRTAWANGVECVEVPLDDLRAALSGPTPAETPQNGPEPALSREQGTSGQSGEGEALGGAESGGGDKPWYFDSLPKDDAEAEKWAAERRSKAAEGGAR